MERTAITPVDSTPIVVSIGTTHPWNIAGVGLDARVAAQYGLRHAMVVVAVSAQDAHGLHAVASIGTNLVRAQLEALPARIAAYRVGALVSSETVAIVADHLRRRACETPVVVDPVIGVTLGGALQSDGHLAAALREHLLVLPAIVTPNALEAEAIVGAPVRDRQSAEAAGRAFLELGACAVLIKGGHFSGDPIDVLLDAEGAVAFEGTRLEGSMRGSGCTLAAALACELALKRPLRLAASAARAYTREKIAQRHMLGGIQVAF